MTEITIPRSVANIGTAAFQKNTLIRCYPGSYAAEYAKKNGLEYEYINDVDAADFEYKVIDDGSINITGYNGTNKKVKIPDTISGKTVTSIGNRAFNNCSAITNVTIPDTVTSIGDEAFGDCTNLSDIVIPDSVTHIGNWAFVRNASLTIITIPDSVTYLGTDIFYDCKNLKTVKLPNSITSLSSGLFDGCVSLTEVTLPDHLTEIGNTAFSRCTSLTEFTLPDSITSINYGTFASCKNLKSIMIPVSVTKIDEMAFSGCTSLTDVYFNGTKTQWEALKIEKDNAPLLSAKIHYLTTVKINPEFIWQKGDNSVKLSWEAVPGAEKYGIAGYQNGKWQLMDKTTDTSYTIKNLKAGQEYKVAVVAKFDGEWYLDYSKAITVTPNGAAADLYPVVKTQVKDGKIGFKWTKVAGAEKYGIGVYQANKWKVVKQVDGSVTTWTSPKVRSGKYRLVVLAKVNGQWVNADVFKKAFYVTVS